MPGCSGLGSYGVDYCANLDLLDENVETSLYVPLLASVGNDGEPKEAYPLHDCQGDCDEDNDCAVRPDAVVTVRLECILSSSSTLILIHLSHVPLQTITGITGLF